MKKRTHCGSAFLLQLKRRTAEKRRIVILCSHINGGCRMNYEILKQKTNMGWNTWNTCNVLSYSHLPEGFTINLCLKDFSCELPLRESLVGRHEEDEEQIFPGARSYDGS